MTEDNPINEAEGSKLRYKELEAKLNTQRKTVEDLKSLGATESIIQAESQQLQEIEKELKNEFQRKRRNESKIQKSETKGTNEQQIESEIELILDASIKVSKLPSSLGWDAEDCVGWHCFKINTGTIKCYPNTALEKLNGSDERKTSSQDSSVTLFLLPGLNVALNYQSHGKKGKDRRAKASFQFF